MTTPNIHRGDIGTTVRASLVDQDGEAIDISASVSRLFRFEKPGAGGRVDLAAAVGTPTNVMEVVVPTGTFNLSGDWRVQGFVQLAVGTSEFWTEILAFTVADQLAAP